jgi:hypothetical protein
MPKRWQLRATRLDGRKRIIGGSVLVYDDRDEAQHWADLGNRISDRDGVVFDVVPVRR